MIIEPINQAQMITMSIVCSPLQPEGCRSYCCDADSETSCSLKKLERCHAAVNRAAPGAKGGAKRRPQVACSVSGQSTWLQMSEARYSYSTESSRDVGGQRAARSLRVSTHHHPLNTYFLTCLRLVPKSPPQQTGLSIFQETKLIGRIKQQAQY